MEWDYEGERELRDAFADMIAGYRLAAQHRGDGRKYYWQWSEQEREARRREARFCLVYEEFRLRHQPELDPHAARNPFGGCGGLQHRRD